MSEATAFVGTVPQTYHHYLVPLLFDEYARDLARRANPRPGERILELAAGTGVVTRLLAESLPHGATLVATDLKEPMLAIAQRYVKPDPNVRFQVVDASSIPFADASFDLICCQYGVMFFPDKLRAMREARRVLAPKGRYVFNVWDSLEHNPIPRVIHDTLARIFPSSPPDFLDATPYAAANRTQTERAAQDAGFQIVSETLELPSSAPTAEEAARAFLEGTPILAALQERGIADPAPIRAQVAEELAKRFGSRPCHATMRATVIAAS